MWMTQLQLCARRHSDGSAKVTQLHLTRHTVLSFPSFTSLSLPLAFDSTMFVSRLSSFDFVHPVIDDVLTVLSVSASCHTSSLCISLTHSLYWLSRSPFPLTSPGASPMTNCPCSCVICDAVYLLCLFSAENKIHLIGYKARCNEWHFQWGLEFAYLVEMYFLNFLTD